MLYIFDMGGVVLHGVFELKTILEEQNFNVEMFDLYRDDLMYDLSAGLISEQEFWNAFNRRHGTSVDHGRWGKTFTPALDPVMVELINGLRLTDRVVCGTNTFAAHWQISLDRDDYACFDAVYASHLMGVAKPASGFWEYILDQEGCSPEETVFIDDFQENVEAACRLGIRGIQFTSPDSLKSDLCLSV